MSVPPAAVAAAAVAAHGGVFQVRIRPAVVAIVFHSYSIIIFYMLNE